MRTFVKAGRVLTIADLLLTFIIPRRFLLLRLLGPSNSMQTWRCSTVHFLAKRRTTAKAFPFRIMPSNIPETMYSLASSSSSILSEIWRATPARTFHATRRTFLLFQCSSYAYFLLTHDQEMPTSGLLYVTYETADIISRSHIEQEMPTSGLSCDLWDGGYHFPLTYRSGNADQWLILWLMRRQLSFPAHI